MSGCPECGAPDERWVGHEVRGVYDGVLFWHCLDCGHAWARFERRGPGDRLHLAAERHAREWNAARSDR